MKDDKTLLYFPVVLLCGVFSKESKQLTCARPLLVGKKKSIFSRRLAMTAALSVICKKTSAVVHHSYMF